MCGDAARVTPLNYRTLNRGCVVVDCTDFLGYTPGAQSRVGGARLAEGVSGR